MGGGDIEEEGDRSGDLEDEGADNDVEILSGGDSQPPLRLSPDGQRQVRPRVYTPQTHPKGLFYRAMDDDAEPPRSDDDLSKLLPADAKLSDVRLDVLELWRMDSDKSTLTEAENVILGETAEDIVVHASLRRDVLCEIIRRLLCLRSLDDVDWLRHVPEEYFERAYKRAEDCDWVIGVEHPWPPVPTEPRESSESSEDDDDASDAEGGGQPAPKAGSSKKRASGSPAPTTPPRGKRPRRTGGQGRGGSGAARQVVHLPEVPSDVSSNESDLPMRHRRLTPPPNAAPDLSHSDTADAISWFVNGVTPPPNAAPDFSHSDTADAISWFVNGVQVHQASQSGKHQIRGYPDYDVVPTSAAEVKCRLVISDYLDLVDGTAPGEDAPWDTVFRDRHVVFWFACREITEEHPGGFSDDFLAVASEHVLVMFNFRRAQWERDHWVILDRTDEAQKKVYSERATRQRSWYKALLKLRAKVALLPARERKGEGHASEELALLKLRAKVALLPARERKWFRCEPGLWRRPRLPVTWIPLPCGDGTPSLRDQLRALDRREPARVHWGLPGAASRLSESVSPSTWGTRVTDPNARIFIPIPDALPVEFIN
ncbi:LOW QUALITY PROTEIN: hypothetical protein PHMEG_00028905 [Phytophthora megakarya]|uniref:Uncharacterized protein n=1 Tax=Phytophthora megakarya TaxID=4795 RepID=A0A225V505_9STRA|nr:LOW QUALITY PROTEIN: hypothetical protein PHMEG_00028905 [Phytophthora megakarya]